MKGFIAGTPIARTFCPRYMQKIVLAKKGFPIQCVNPIARTKTFVFALRLAG